MGKILFEKLKAKIAEQGLVIVMNLLGDLLIQFGNMLKETSNESTKQTNS